MRAQRLCEEAEGISRVGEKPRNSFSSTRPCSPPCEHG